MRSVVTIFLLCAVACLGCEEDMRAQGDTFPAGTDAGSVAVPDGLHALEGSVPGLLLGLWGSSEIPLRFVGGGPEGGFVLVQDGSVVRRERTPPGPTLWWVHGLDSVGVWACGDGGRIIRLSADGWTEEQTGLPANATLWGLWTVDGGDVWAVGGSNAFNGPKAIILHSTGDGSWELMDVPEEARSVNIYKVWGRGPDDVYFVGERGIGLHWDGSEISLMPLNSPDLFFTLHGRGDLVLAVGGTSSGVVNRLGPEGWVEDGLPEGQPRLNGVYVGPDGHAVSSGERGIVLRRDLNGDWGRLPLVGPDDGRRYTFHAIRSESALWTVGGDFSSGQEGVIYTDFRPLPRLAFDEIIEPLLSDDFADAGALVHDGGLDAASVDAGVDAEIDAEVDAVIDTAIDAEPDADLDGQLMDRGVDEDAARQDGGMAEDGTVDGSVDLCGNGAVDEGEACDDGNLVNEDACLNTCEEAHCLDGFIGPGEACDDGNDIDTDACRNNCELARCGDGVVGPGEACDDGNQIEDDACPNSCEAPRCGDGILSPGELCDDGNEAPDDGCSALCVVECGNGEVDGGEECDDGNDIPRDGCEADCTVSACGNGRRERGEGEQCDDGNRMNNDGCDERCQYECGNGLIQGDEECDDGNRWDEDACDRYCRLECGNGYRNFLEDCDDGNDDPDDGCDACNSDDLVGRGESCLEYACDPELMPELVCLGVASAGFIDIDGDGRDDGFPPYCLVQCNGQEDCLGTECCEAPGPQLAIAYCVPRVLGSECD